MSKPDATRCDGTREWRPQPAAAASAARVRVGYCMYAADWMPPSVSAAGALHFKYWPGSRQRSDRGQPSRAHPVGWVVETPVDAKKCLPSRKKNPFTPGMQKG